MGNCTSPGFGPLPTAKLILMDGELQEFSNSEKVSELLKRNPDCFICNSDEMEFDGLVTAMDGGEALRPGQVYFELPLVFLKQKLQAEDMASLAVKASLALSSYNDYNQVYGCCGRGSPRRTLVLEDHDQLVFFHEENVGVRSSSRRKSAAVASGGDRTVVPAASHYDLRFVRRRRPAAAGASVAKFTATLSAILEIDEYN